MAKLPFGVVTLFRGDKTGIECCTTEITLCKDCENFSHETGICTSWGSWTEEVGYCHKSKKKKTEDVIALDFSEDIDTPSRYQTSDGKWHEGMIGGD